MLVQLGYRGQRASCLSPVEASCFGGRDLHLSLVVVKPVENRLIVDEGKKQKKAYVEYHKNMSMNTNA